MKKFKRVLTSLVMGLTCVATLAGCGKDPEIESISVKSGLQTIYLKNDEVSFDDLKVKVVYEDGTEKIVGKNELTIGEFSTDALGTYNVKISYEGKTITVKLKVTNNKDEVYDILAVENNKNYLQYESALNPSSGADFESVFIDREISDSTVYKVGSDNPFVYNMNLTALDDEGEYVEGLETTRTVTTVYVKDSLTGTYTKLEGNNIATYVEIDDENSSYQFKDAAENKFFKLEVRPYYLKESQLASASNYTKSIEFKVVEGYNITNAKQLGILNNVNEIAEYTYANSTDEDTVNLYEEWSEFLSDNGITRVDNTKAIILHNNIVVTGADVPSVLLARPTSDTTNPNAGAEVTNQNALYTDSNNNKYVLEENLDGEKCDGSNVYCHQISENDTFTIHGNFFTLDVDLPTVDTTLLPNYGSTTSLFRFVSTYSAIEGEEETLTTNNEDAIEASTNTFVNIHNLNSIGNAIRTDSTAQENNADSAQMGGLIFVKAPAVTLNVKNSIIKAYLINFYIEQRLSTINLEDVKSYDAYQSIVYGYNGGNMSINDSFLERAGGPVILVATDDNDSSKKMVTKIDVNNSKLESLVSGREPWFAIYSMTPLATQLKSQNGQFSQLGTFIAENSGSEIEAQLVNAIFVNISNDDDTSASTQPLARLTIDGEIVADTTGFTDSGLTGNKAMINLYSGYGAPVFTNDGAIMAVLPTGEDEFSIIDNIGTDTEQLDQMSWYLAMRADNSQGNKDYLTIHQGEMIMVIEYFELSQPDNN